MNTNIFNFSEVDPSPGDIAFRIGAILVFAVLAHVLVRVIRNVSDWVFKQSAAKKSPVRFVVQHAKFVTLSGLVLSIVTFIIYAVALGFILEATGLEPRKFLATYLATASVIGLAVGFGSQGLVQDLVTGITLIVSDVLDVGDLIEVSGQTGRVQKVGLRYTEITNFLNQQVFVPNRMIMNISRFAGGGVFAYADVQMPAAADSKKVVEMVGAIAKGIRSQFNAIVLSEPVVSDVQTAEPGGWQFLRVQFKLWPGQGSVIETTFRQRMVHALKALDPGYADWMVTVTYRISGAMLPRE